MFHGSQDQRISPYNRMSSTRSFISRPDQLDNFIMLQKMGIFQAPPPPFFSNPYPSFPVHQQLPPLLPLPAATPRHATIARGQSCPSVKKRANYNDVKTNNFFTPKKTKPHTKNANKNGKNSPKLMTASSSPPETPRNEDIKKALPAMRRAAPTDHGARRSMSMNAVKAEGEHFGTNSMFFGSGVFTISPPPSSLPLPSFSLRPKLSCNSQVAMVDTGATDSLRRYLQLG